MANATVNATLFRAASIAQSNEGTRYYLNGVYIEPHPHLPGVLMTATDGHRLVNVYDAQGTCDSACILQLPPALLKECAGKRNEKRLLYVIDGTPSILSCLAEKNKGIAYEAIISDPLTQRIAVAPGRCLVDGTFPDWRRVVPQSIATCSPEGAAFDPAYLGDFAKVGALLAKADDTSAKSIPAISIAIADRGSPALIRFFGVDHAFGVLMPVRGTLRHALLPSYMIGPGSENDAIASDTSPQ